MAIERDLLLPTHVGVHLFANLYSPRRIGACHRTGRRLAIILYHAAQGIIPFRAASGKKPREWVVKGRIGLVTADWSTDRSTIFVTSIDRERKTALFNVELDGSNHLLLKDDKDSSECAVPSPAGKL